MIYRQPFSGQYPITQRFGEKYTSTSHTGIDYACPVNTPVLASANGQVIHSGWKTGGYGYCVFLKHSDGNTTIYEHLGSKIPVFLGQVVAQGEVIGYSGSTGNSTGPHLHFEVQNKDGKPFDPMLLNMMTVDDSIANKPKPVVTHPEIHAGTVRVICELPANVRDVIDHNRINGQKQPGDVFDITEGTITIWGLPFRRIIPRHVDDLGGLVAEYDSYGTQMLENVG